LTGRQHFAAACCFNFDPLKPSILISLALLLCSGTTFGINAPQSQFFFRENRGQWDADIRFRCTNGDRDIAFCKDRIVFGTRRVVDPALPYEGMLPTKCAPQLMNF